MIPRPADREGEHARKILHIEDSQENRELVSAVLEADGYTVTEAPDGLAGIEAAIREQPALILLDIGLPHVDGYEVVGVIKSFPQFTATPVIALTASVLKGDRARTLVAGCDGYIEKPIDVDVFAGQVAGFLRGRRERIETRDEAPYLRELNQRLVFRLVQQIETLKEQMAELKRTQAQLIQTTKLAAIGELSANIAHEINSPLTSVCGFAAYLAESLRPEAPMREELDLIVAEATRARNIVRDLLDFSRPREFAPELTDLRTVLSQTLAMVRRQGALDRFRVEECYAEELPLVVVDPSRIKQVFVNVINNAVGAMAPGGRLTVSATGSAAGLRVTFTDTGVGIPAESLEKIFDPFFTTKPPASGTGLRLSVSLGIVQRHGGSIEVTSEVGQGSTFTITLPTETR